jgi:hypothetical protein
MSKKISQLTLRNCGSSTLRQDTHQVEKTDALQIVPPSGRISQSLDVMLSSFFRSSGRGPNRPQKRDSRFTLIIAATKVHISILSPSRSRYGRPNKVFCSSTHLGGVPKFCLVEQAAAESSAGILQTMQRPADTYVKTGNHTRICMCSAAVPKGKWTVNLGVLGCAYY